MQCADAIDENEGIGIKQMLLVVEMAKQVCYAIQTNAYPSARVFANVQAHARVCTLTKWLAVIRIEEDWAIMNVVLCVRAFSCVRYIFVCGYVRL